MTQTLGQYIKEIESELARPEISSQRRRYLEDHYSEISLYFMTHSTDSEVPTSLELFCSQNPESEECRIFDV